RNGIYGYGCQTGIAASPWNITNAVYSYNHIYNLGGVGSTGQALSPNGIAFSTVAGGLAEHNLIHDIGGNNFTCGGPTGIIAYKSDMIIMRYNEAYNVRPLNFTTGCDWVAFDLDIGVSNSIAEYNYGHDNAGACLLNFANDGPNFFRYNVCENNDLFGASGGQLAIQPPYPGLVQVYNNTIYSAPATTTGEPPACITLGGFGAYAAGSLIENNICDFHRATQSGYGGGIVFNGADVTAVAIKNNLYSTNINYWRYAWD